MSDKQESAGSARRGGPTRFLLVGGGVLAATLIDRRARGGRLRARTSPSGARDLTSRHADRRRRHLAGVRGRRHAPGFIQSDELRTPVAWSEIPADLKNATVAIEDQRFYKNDGVDLTGHLPRRRQGPARTAKRCRAARRSRCSSMRNLYLGGDEHTLKQKIIEAKLAIEYNEHHSKHSILTELPQQRPLRHGRRADRARRAGRRAHLLRQAGLRSSTSSSRRCSPACHRRPRSTTRSSIPPPRGERRNEVLGEDGRTALHQPGAGRGRRGGAAGDRTTATTTPHA